MSGATRDIGLLAIVNRGEAAMRCIRSAKALRAREGSALRTLALYTQADREAPFVRYADRSLRLPEPRGAVAAYLDHDALVELLRDAAVDAVWPGWGFSAEHPEFVDKLAAAGIRFLGPSGAAMRQLGDKIASKELAEHVGVPVTPWSGGAVANFEEGSRAAERIGYPLVVKASAGGGGRGIRFVNAPEELEEAMRSARSEAEGAFGDGRLFLESAVRAGRHIEVQILADQHGHVFALGARDCSVQRRFQKVLEEAPPPSLSEQTLSGLLRDARRIAAEVAYSGAGTVEFLVDGEAYYFLEMNPRLQVEHGITEAITGLDLVELQIRIARGEDLGDLSFRESGHAIEARVCAEDPDAGFIPSPGRIARFDPVLGPKVRIDTGVAPGTDVPDAFDSLIAKVITTGDDRHEAVSRLRAALADFDLVIEGGATNKGYLLEVLEDPEFAAGGVDVGWLDRFGEARNRERAHAVPALVAAAILTYQRGRNLARLNFFADASNPSPDRVPASVGQEIDLSYEGEQYPLEVFALGGWRYRVYMDGDFVTATLREEGSHRARLEIGETVLPILYDATDAGLRLEVAGLAHRFGWQTVGQVRAATPAMVIGVHVAVGDRVEVGQPLGILEAMKMEIGFDAPVAGIVTDVGVRAGQQVKAGEVLLVVDPADEGGEAAASERLVLPKLADPLAPLFGDSEPLGAPDFARAARCEVGRRRQALASVGDEVRRVILGYDINPARAHLLIEFLEAPLGADLPRDFRNELAEIAGMLEAAADIEQLFVRSPRASVSGELGPSNSARFRMFVRRLRAGGAGIAPEFLELVSKALRHYGIEGLDHSDALERAVLRMIASRAPNQKRQEILLGLIRQVVALSRAGVSLTTRWPLADALTRLSDMRGLVSDAVADAAIDARYEVFERPGIDARLAETGRELDVWLAASGTEATDPPEGVLRDLADAPRAIFDQVGDALGDADSRRRGLALEAQLRRLYSPVAFTTRLAAVHGGVSILRAKLEDERVIIGAACERRYAAQAFDWLQRTAASLRDQHEWPAVSALELLISQKLDENDAAVHEAIREGLVEGLPAARVTVTQVRSGEPDHCTTFVPSASGYLLSEDFHGIHPEAAERIDLARLVQFDLERREAPEDLYAFHARSREVPEDERVFVLADVRGRRIEPDRKNEI
ncbi:MAG: ATP-grasp domain-containing protein, partial [Myxococcales bacterium]|nr:ATP-grasp domain-containing protein [Myxococcales bacterium]